jgi:GNAT superfamily N-acetyltransferase
MDRTRPAPSQSPYDIAFGGAARVYAEHFQALLSIVQPVEARPFPNGRWQHFPNRRKWYTTTDEFYVLQGDPAAVIRAIRASAVGPHHVIDLIGTDPATDDPAYRAAGYRLDSVEILMERPVTPEDLDRVDDPRVVRTLTDGQIERLAEVWNAGRTANGYQPITAAHNAYPGLVQRFIEIDGVPAAYGRAIVIGDDALLADVNTFPAFRRQGLGRAIMDALHAGIAREGGRRVVLTSTEMGLPLYRQLGYRTLAEDWIYVSTP